jgi:hypothetical protein
MGEHENRLGYSREEIKLRRELQRAAQAVQPDCVTGWLLTRRRIARHEARRNNFRQWSITVTTVIVAVIVLYFTGSL